MIRAGRYCYFFSLWAHALEGAIDFEARTLHSLEAKVEHGVVRVLEPGCRALIVGPSFVFFKLFCVSEPYSWSLR